MFVSKNFHVDNVTTPSPTTPPPPKPTMYLIDGALIVKKIQLTLITLSQIPQLRVNCNPTQHIRLLLSDIYYIKSLLNSFSV